MAGVAPAARRVVGVTAGGSCWMQVPEKDPVEWHTVPLGQQSPYDPAQQTFQRTELKRGVSMFGTSALYTLDVL